MTEQDAQPATDSYRQQQLANAVQVEVARGARVESQTAYNAVLRKGGTTNHTLHLILTIVTLGFWSLVWITLAIINMVSKATILLSVDQFGNVLRQ